MCKNLPKGIPLNSLAIEKLLLANNELIVPTTVLGLTSYTDLKQTHDNDFSALDFNIYDNILLTH